MKFGLDRTFRLTEDGERIEGVHRLIFVHNVNYFLTTMSVFRDGVIECWLQQLPLDQFEKLIRSGWVVTCPPDGETVYADGLATFKVAGVSAVSPDDFVKDIADEIERLNGRPTSVNLAREAWAAYQATPNDETKVRLRKLYEAVPAHNRRYVGEMDGGDYPIRRVLNPEQFP